MSYKIPQEVKKVASALSEAGYKAYPVGGCVRDMLMRREPKDWDVTTDARPEDIQEIFEDSVYENDFGTVVVKTGSDIERLKLIEVTTFRVESDYSDRRHPDNVSFTNKVEDDLGRRDFTINAMAFDLDKEEVVDPYGGEKDLEKKLIKTVGDPKKRFKEDALRLLRAARFATELEFNIEKQTKKLIKEKADSLEEIAIERIRDEFVKIIMADNADGGVRLLEDLGLLEYIIPELREGIGCDQAHHHIYTVWEHNVRSLKYAAENNYSLEIRLAALLHDVGKPESKEGKGEEATFYNHEVIGAKITEKILKRLKFPKEVIKDVVHLVRYHLFYYNVGEVTESGVRRFLSRVGLEYVDDLMKLRKADRIGSGVPKAFPYRFRHLLFMIDKVKRDPVSTDMLEVDGNDVMNISDIDPGPKVGWVLKALMEEVLDDPGRNKKEYLEKRIKDLVDLPDEELKKKAKIGETKIEEFEKGVIKDLKKKHHVK
ncbi:MAG TPA: HD domain-containing protein [Candidatus Paceibacterota bacterium]|nr:HD domain-containing protein [Candidatus Paceibacterota bacterium]